MCDLAARCFRIRQLSSASPQGGGLGDTRATLRRIFKGYGGGEGKKTDLYNCIKVTIEEF